MTAPSPQSKEDPVKRTAHIGAVTIAAALGLAACGSSTTKPAAGGSTTTQKPSGSSDNGSVTCGKPSGSGAYKVAFVYVGTVNDGGWTTAHDKGRQLAQTNLGDKVKTTYKATVKEGPEAAAAIESLIADGNRMIFATSFGFQDSMETEAKKHPEVCFEQATGFKTSANFAEYFGAAEDTDYLTGMAAGAASKNGKLGFVAPFPIPEVIREINSFALGAQTTHPGATVQVAWTKSWFDPTKERQAAEGLVAAGVDALGQGQDSPATGEVAKAKKLPWAGYDTDQSANFPDNWLTATVYNWGPYYQSRIAAAMAGTWKSGSYYGGPKDDFVGLAPFGKLVDQKTKDAIASKLAGFKDGSFYHLTGPLKDQSGAEKVAAGKALELKDILSMDWFVEGVKGSPKG